MTNIYLNEEQSDIWEAGYRKAMAALVAAAIMTLVLAMILPLYAVSIIVIFISALVGISVFVMILPSVWYYMPPELTDDWMRCRKKPVEVQFRQIRGKGMREEIETREGTLFGYRGQDYIIKGVEGEEYPCEIEIFNKTYDIIEEATE